MIYRSHWRLWMVIGLVFVPVSLAVTFLENLVGLDWAMELADSTVVEPMIELIGVTAGAFFGATVVSVAVFAALRDLDEGNQPSVEGALRRILERGPSLVGEAVAYTAAITALSITVIGVPIAINRAVAWAVAAQTVVIEDKPALGALGRSAELVKGSWLRVLLTVALITLFVGLPGPLIVFGLLVFTRPPLTETIYPLLSLLYIFVLFPIGFIASGLLYGDLCAVRERRETENL
jgi:hypothetical protein